MPTLYNPGEPVWDQETGDPVVDPATGDVLRVEAGGRPWTDPITGRRHETDDVTNAAWWRVTLRLGESRRNVRLGLDLLHLVFDAGAGVDVALGAVADQILTTPGVAALDGPPRDVQLDRARRRLRATFGVLRADGTRADVPVDVVG